MNCQAMSCGSAAHTRASRPTLKQFSSVLPRPVAHIRAGANKVRRNTPSAPVFQHAASAFLSRSRPTSKTAAHVVPVLCTLSCLVTSKKIAQWVRQACMLCHKPACCHKAYIVRNPKGPHRKLLTAGGNRSKTVVQAANSEQGVP